MTDSNSLPWSEAAALVQAATRVIAVTHVNPDGDAIGSMMGMTLTLQALGKTVIPAVDTGTPAHLKFIPGSEAVRSVLTDETADLVISLDASDVRRTGEVGRYALALGKPVIMVDHHQTNTLFGTVNLLNAETPATAEVLVDWITAVGWPLSRDAAYALLTGIVTDTLCFRTNTTTADTLDKARRLMNAGAPLNAITQQTVNRRSAATFRLWARVMPSLQIEDHAAWVCIGLEAKREAGYEEEGSAGGLAQLLNEADDAYVTAVFVEKSSEAVEVHFRAHPGFNVADLARAIGGGGHILASGATVQGTLSEALALVLPKLKEVARAGVPLFA
jgi:phosphoesterase RecJ-like protein